MSLIRKTALFPAKHSNGKLILLLCGFGGRLWHARRLVKVLNSLGYDVRAYEFQDRLFNEGNPQHLLDLANEMTIESEKQVAEHSGEVIFVGISIGVLMVLNVLRRSACVTKAIGYTGGDIVKAIKKSFPNKWQQPESELHATLAEINMFTDPELLSGKQMVFVLPTHDRYIDPEEVRTELQHQVAAGNDLITVERKPFGHIGTIINETFIHPKRIIGYLQLLNEDI